MQLDLDWGKAWGALPFLLEGVKLTVIITVGGLILGFLIGAFVGVARLSKRRLVYGTATVYVEFFRGTPLLVQALYLYFGVNQILQQTMDWRIDSVPSGIIIIALNAGAYIAEIVRGAIQSIDKGQNEAGRSLGMTASQSFLYIVWPQALKRMIPPLGNQFIISLKDTSLLAFIAVGELTRQSQVAVSGTFAAFEIYTITAALYLMMTLSISAALRWYERRMDIV